MYTLARYLHRLGIRANKLRALAVTSAARVDVLLNIPAVGETVSGYEANGWVGIGAPHGTPAEIVDALNRLINAALADTKFIGRLADLGATPLARSPAQ